MPDTNETFTEQVDVSTLPDGEFIGRLGSKSLRSSAGRSTTWRSSTPSGTGSPNWNARTRSCARRLEEPGS